MWIRSQDGKRLIKTEVIGIYDKNLWCDDVNEKLGTYETEERALEVLDEIEVYLIRSKTIDRCDAVKSLGTAIDEISCAVYKMPKE